MEYFLSTAIETTSLDYATSDRRSDAGFFGVSPETWTRILVIAALFSAVFWPNLHRLWLKTNPFNGEANWSHSIFVPLIGLYYLFVNREELVKAGAKEFIWGPILRRGRAISALVMALVGTAMYFAARKHDGVIFSMISPAGVAMASLGILVLLLDWSLATMLFGIGVYAYGIYPGRNDYVKDLGMVITLFGIVLMLNGWSAMKIAWFPVAFLVVAIPWPGLVYSWVAEPLSQMAAHIAVDVLKVTGVDANWSGTKIIVSRVAAPPRILNVAEACAGMRSLMTFIAVAGAIAFLSHRVLWQRLTIVISAIPIAIFCNVMRISGQGLLDHYVSEKWSDSFAHQFVGMVMLVPAFFLILLVGVVLDKMFIEEADETEIRGSKPRPMTTAIAPRASAIPSVGAVSVGAVSSAPTRPSAPAVQIPGQKPATAAAAPTVAPTAAPTVAPAVTQTVTAPATPAVPQRPAVMPPRPATAVTPPRPGIPPRPAMAGMPPRPITAANPRPRPAGLPPVNGASSPGTPPVNRPSTVQLPGKAAPKEST